MRVAERRLLILLTLFRLEEVGGRSTLLEIGEENRHIRPRLQGILSDEGVRPGRCHVMTVVGVVDSDLQQFQHLQYEPKPSLAAPSSCLVQDTLNDGACLLVFFWRTRLEIAIMECLE